MLSNIGPLKIFAANLRPSDTFLAKYEINSINTNRGNNPRGQPAGTNREKNFSWCLWSPNIVAPPTMVKLIKKDNIEWAVE